MEGRSGLEIGAMRENAAKDKFGLYFQPPAFRSHLKQPIPQTPRPLRAERGRPTFLHHIPHRNPKAYPPPVAQPTSQGRPKPTTSLPPTTRRLDPRRLPPRHTRRFPYILI